MKTLLLCSYRLCDEDFEHALGLPHSSENLIDLRISQLKDMGHEVICILAGRESDVQLRVSRLIQECELVFDANEPTSVLSNLKSGLHAVENEACFVLPVEVAPPPIEIWNFLFNEYVKVGYRTPDTLFQAMNPDQGAPWHLGFPLLVTREGGKMLKNTSDLKGLVDPRIKYLQLPFSPQSALAPLTIPI